MAQGEGPAVEELIARLESSPESVRRVAALDLARAGGERALAALLDRLGRETDEKTARLIVKGLGEAGYAPAKAALWGLYADRRTPVRLAHDAVLAHDLIEVGLHHGGTEGTERGRG